MSTPPSTTAKLAADQAVVALGANLPSPVGPPEETLYAALAALEELAAEPVVCSTLISTSPEDCPPGTPDFLNAVALLRLAEPLSPEQLLHALQAIETGLGRRRGELRNAPRSLDLDLICYGDRRLDTPTLTLPHPRAWQREFVLAPLAELRPDLVLPGQGCSVQARLDWLRAQR